MSYTFSLVRSIVDSFVPFSDRLPFMDDDPAQPARSKNSQRVRLNFARTVLRRSPQNLHLQAAAKKILEEEKTQQAEACLTRQAYAQAQISKLASPVDLLVPGSGTVMTTVATAGSIITTQQKGAQNGYTSRKFLKTAASLIVSIGSIVCAPVIAPVVMPYVTAATAGAVAGGVLGTAVTLDIVNTVRARIA